MTDTYSYDAYGNILKAQGNTENEFLYTGEQYSAATGLYYLRARYMNPQTGTFISMDSYPGNTYDPVSLHKYLYANANPVMNSDPTGYFTMSYEEVKYNAMCLAIAASLVYTLKQVMPIANAMTEYVDAMAAILLDERDKIYDIPDEIVNKVNELVQEANESRKNACYVVYTLVDDDGVVRYVGRTKDYTNRMRQHRRPGGKIEQYHLKEGAIVLRNLTKEQAHGLEQTLLFLYHTDNFLKDSSIKYYNFINGVGKSNVNRADYYNAAKNYMENYPSLFENFEEEERNALREEMGAWWK